MIFLLQGASSIVCFFFYQELNKRHELLYSLVDETRSHYDNGIICIGEGSTKKDCGQSSSSNILSTKCAESSSFFLVFVYSSVHWMQLFIFGSFTLIGMPALSIHGFD